MRSDEVATTSAAHGEQGLRHGAHRGPWHWARLLAVAVGFCTAITPLAYAGPDEDRATAEKLIDEGLTLARAQEFRAAIPKFEAALKLYPHPETLHNLGRAHEELGELRQAHDYFTQALKDDYAFAADGRQRLARIESELRKSFARLTVRTTPSQVTVVLTFPSGEAETHLATPFVAWIPAGKNTIVGTLPGFKTGEETLKLAAGEERELNLVLLPEPKQGFLQISVNQPGAKITLSGELIGRSPLPGTAWNVGVYELEVTLHGFQPYREQIIISEDAVTSVTAALVAKELGSTPKVDEGVPAWVGWTLVGSGVLAGGTALYLQLGKAQSAQDAADRAFAAGDTAKDTRLHQRALDYQTAAMVTGAVGVVLAGTGLYLLVGLSGDDSAAALPRFTPSVALTKDGGYVGATVSF